MKGRSLHSLRPVEMTGRAPGRDDIEDLCRHSGLTPFVIPGVTENLLTGRAVRGPSDIKMAKNMMDGPVSGLFCSIFGTVRQKIVQKDVGRGVGSEVDFWFVTPIAG